MNNGVRATFHNYAKSAIEKTDDFIKYMKLKGWIETPPLYDYVSPDFKEQVACNEIYLLWDHLAFRYNNIRQTQFFSSYASDEEFQSLLKRGSAVLRKQAKEIEDLLIQIGVTLPTSYTDIVPTPDNTQMIEDEFMFNNTLFGMQNAAALHGIALEEVIVNDNIRKFFKKLTFSELEIIDTMIKYGKLKGWITVVPGYKIGKT